MKSRSDVVIHIAPDCPPEIEAHVRRTNPGASIMGRSISRRHVPGPRVELPGQLELPDTAPQPAELAKRLAAAPMRPGVPQKPCDVGLFDDTQTQIDLEEMLG